MRGFCSPQEVYAGRLVFSSRRVFMCFMCASFSPLMGRFFVEHLLGYFIPQDPSLGFLELFQAVLVVVHGDIPRLMALVLGANKLLAMIKNIGGFHPIVIGKVFLQFISQSIVLQLRGSFQEHPSPHQNILGIFLFRFALLMFFHIFVNFISTHEIPLSSILLK